MKKSLERREMPKEADAVVASLAERSPNPFSSMAMSPNRQYAVIAGKDNLQLVKVNSEGIKSLRKFKISQHFQAPGDGTSQVGKTRYYDIRDNFKLSKQQTHSHPRANMTHGNVGVTCVAWSKPLHKSTADGASERGEDRKREDEKIDSIVAAAGSNGIVAVWSARQAFFSEGSGESSTLANQQPEAILSQHTRAVNKLAWHPNKPGLLLTASQDATAKLWERRAVTPKVDNESNAKLHFRFFNKIQSDNSRSYSWFCRGTFEPKSEAVRDIQWSKFQDDIFALVTVSGSLVVYSMHITAKAIVKIAAHNGDATSLDWHPTRKYVIATGGSADRCVKVWDLESSISMTKRDDTNIANNSNTWNTTKSEVSTNSCSSSETDKSGPSSSGYATMISLGGRAISGTSQGGGIRYKSSLGSAMTMHVLSTSSAVTKLRWRPPAFDSFSSEDDDEVDRHDSMMAVATARLTSAGGSGVLSLWSFNRPFMPLSVVEGHEDGAVADFAWLQTPQPHVKTRKKSKFSPSDINRPSSKNDSRRDRKKQVIPPNDESILIRSSGRGDMESILFDNREKEKDDEKSESYVSCIWQHILSVGRDGRCLLQSFARGDRPISRVPSSCFAMANLSPFQRGFGSLQIFSINQQVPTGPKSDFKLTSLRQDELTANSPGVFQEFPLEENKLDSDQDDSWVPGKRLPATMPDLVFNVVDQGDLNASGLPIETNEEALCIAPELVHLSRFASLYILYPNSRYRTRVDLCLHNGEVAEDLNCRPLARMWRSVASMLSGSGLDELPTSGTPTQAINAMQFAIIPTIKSLLLERADAGDVQTCVALCEVLQIIQPGEKTRVPGLELSLVREWYISYIDLLQQMCLFSSATFLISSCKDPFIGALNQQSTTIHESCPRCGKPLQPSTDTAGSSLSITGRRVCTNCRRRVGLCFLCHEPVRGMFVWCPGCGHGGHLDHALQWFGGLDGKAVREVCPTGCGHRCNFMQTLSAFPRTDSMVCLQVPDSPEFTSK